MKKLLGTVVLGLLLSGNAYAEKKTWICQSERFGDFIWEYDKKNIYQKFPADDVRIFKITKDHREHGISIFGISKGKIWDLDVYMDFQKMYVKVRQLDRDFGISGSYTDTNCRVY